MEFFQAILPELSGKGRSGVPVIDLCRVHADLAPVFLFAKRQTSRNPSSRSVPAPLMGTCHVFPGRVNQSVLVTRERCAIRVGPYPADESVWFRSPQRISSFIVPSACMIRTIGGSAMAEGISGWGAPSGRTVLSSNGVATVRQGQGSAHDGDALSRTIAPISGSGQLLSRVCFDNIVTIDLRSSSSWINPLASNSISRTFFSSITTRSSEISVPETTIIFNQFLPLPGLVLKPGDFCIRLR